jgi:hypothetical protein
VDAEPGFVPLFNGKDLSGWKVVGHKGWTVKDGVLIGEAGPGQDGFLMSERRFKDYELELEVKLTAFADTGVFVRAWPDGAVGGSDFIEVQLMDNKLLTKVFGVEADKILNRRHGAVVNMADPKPAVEPSIGAWQPVRLRVEGQRLQVWLAGQRVIDTKVKDLPDEGALALQLQAGRAEFRNLRVAPTPKTDASRFTNSLGMQFALVPKGKAWLGGAGGRPATARSSSRTTSTWASTRSPRRTGRR